MTPNNRHEAYLAAIAGDPVQYPAKPLTREEAYLDRIAKNGSGGGGSSLPAGGTAGQLLAKKTNADGDAEWKTLLPSDIGEHGVAELDETGRVPSSHLPSYVDDVIEGYLHDGKWYSDDQYTEEVAGEEGKIYVDLATDKEYRWGGSVFVEISKSVSPYTSNPAMDGTASAGSSNDYARGDHVHPTDTSRASATSVGDLTSLTTTEKSNLVGAINEVNAKPSGGGNKTGMLGKSFRPQYKPTWENKTWTGLTNFDGENVWTDGVDTYYSKGTTQKVLNKSNSSWENKTWTGLSDFDGKYIWSDGDNIYYSKGTNNHYQLGKNDYGLYNSTWTAKSWNFTGFYGTEIWTDGDDVYFSGSLLQKKLDKTTGQWVNKTWNGLEKPRANNIWTDGKDIYYLYKSGNTIISKILDKETSTWNDVEWQLGVNDMYGSLIWTDGTDIFGTTGNLNGNIRLIPDNHSAEIVHWNPSPGTGDQIWTDGNDIYYSNGTTQRVYKKVSIKTTFAR